MEVLKERESLQKKEAKRIEVTKQKENKRIYLASPHMGGCLLYTSDAADE